VLTPDEADQILGVLRDLTADGLLSVVLITHKLREVNAFAREVTVLRGGRRVASGAVIDFRREDLVVAMVGAAVPAGPATRTTRPVGASTLELEALTVRNDKGVEAVRDLSLTVRAGEIVGIAGVSGNGQRELVQALAGQRDVERGMVRVAGMPYVPTRAEMRRHRVYVLPEEPLLNACVRTMSVAENLAFRSFDEPRHTIGGWLVRRGSLRAEARELIARHGIRTQSPDARLETLSGGNVQRTVLARELAPAAAVLVVQNPCAGLDFAATAEIRGRIMAARAAGAAVLLVSEDLDEVLELADRIVVIFEGRFVHETTREGADLHTIGHFMATHAGAL
jgi:simple sugar transport system ATP-binding protein